MDRNQPRMPAAQTRTMAQMFRMVDRSLDTGFAEAAGGSAVGLCAEMRGVVGERCVASTLWRWLWKDEKEEARR